MHQLPLVLFKVWLLFPSTALGLSGGRLLYIYCIYSTVLAVQCLDVSVQSSTRMSLLKEAWELKRRKSSETLKPFSLDLVLAWTR